MKLNTPYDKEIGDVILDHIVEGKTLKWICEQEGMPSKAQFNRWRRENEEFDTQVLDALRQQAIYELDEAKHLMDTVFGENEKYLQPKTASAVVQAARYQADIRIRRAGLLDHQLSEKNRHEVSGKGGGPIKIEVMKFSE